MLDYCLSQVQEPANVQQQDHLLLPHELIISINCIPKVDISIWGEK